MNLETLKQLFAEERAVSPVIGVILMVAITVILAAVIGTFVLGMGDEIGTRTPQASFGFDYDGSSTLTITHNGGDSIADGELTTKVTGDSTHSVGSWSSSTVSAGVSQDVSNLDSSGAVVRIVWENPDSDETAVLATYTVP